MDFAVPKAVKRLGDTFEKEGFEVRIVGGWVRDTLQGITPKDLDLATTATPEQMIALCEKHGLACIPTGLQHGTVTVAHSSKKARRKSGVEPEMIPAYEITTLRRDVETDGRHAEVEFTTDWHLDAARRDFTVNAMMIGMDGRLYDYFNGAGHLKDRRIIFVGDAEARVREDYLRILRYFRFRSRIGDRTHDRDTLAVIRKTAEGLEKISVERIWSEMARILGGNPEMLTLCLIDMLDTGVLARIGLPKAERYDIVHATIVRGQSDNPLTVLAALTATPMEQRWHMSGDESRLLRLLQEHHRIPRPELAYFQELALRRNVGYEHALEVCRLFGPSEILREFSQWVMPIFPVTGDDLANLGIPEGIHCGQILRQLQQKWRDSQFSLDKDALLCDAVMVEFADEDISTHG